MWRRELLHAERIAFDIEITEHDLLCCAFAARVDHAYVFSADRLAEIVEILGSDVPKVAQNGQFDLYFLRRFCDIEVANYADDTIIAWHSCYPELASASQDKKGAKRTRKSLAFLASLFTTDTYWKDYDVDERGMMELCGRDAMITLDVMNQLDDVIDSQGVRDIYEHQLRLIEPCITMQERGLRIDEHRREDVLDKINAEVARLQGELEQIVDPIFHERRDAVRRDHLFWTTVTCPCCRNGKNKREECWSCAGFEKKPGKRKLADSGKQLEPCAECGGKGQWETFEFNPSSHDQVKIWLYELLKMPKRYKDKKPTSDEEALKGLLATCTD